MIPPMLSAHAACAAAGAAPPLADAVIGAKHAIDEGLMGLAPAIGLDRLASPNAAGTPC